MVLMLRKLDAEEEDIRLSVQEIKTTLCTSRMSPDVMWRVIAARDLKI